ncbi:MAG TPA: R2-like ligand-binding oxidase [Acidimicrobiales bacterium]|nr:R2-like ligand-binding oxidase [Acidimicrobiales bacterium]
MSEDLDATVRAARRWSDWASPRGLRTDTLPWRLWERAKTLVWDPADLDLSGDATAYAALPELARLGVANLVRGFMIGEEGVTLDVVPLLVAMADEGRIEEVMYLTTFAFEEAKHVDFFRRWVDAVGIDYARLDAAVAERLGTTGEVPGQRQGIFEAELPRVMRRLIGDHSPEAVLDASVTYNQFVEGCLAVAGYRVFDLWFEQFGTLSGLRRGLALVRRDESRHITYGTYLCRRLLAADPDLVEAATARLSQLHRAYEATAAGRAGYGSGDTLGSFGEFLDVQVRRRLALLWRRSPDLDLVPEEV